MDADGTLSAEEGENHLLWTALHGNPMSRCKILPESPTLKRKRERTISSGLLCTGIR